MKKILFFAAAALSLAACSNEGVITDGVDIPQPSEGTYLYLNLSLPNGEPITYSEQHTTAERNVTRLDVYQFNGADGSAKLEAVHTGVNVSLSGSNHRATIHVKDAGDKTFVVVANNGGTNLSHFNLPSVAPELASASTLDEFKAEVSNKLQSEVLNGKDLVMTGVTTANVVALNTTSVNVNLTRVMARLDIVNKDPLLRVDRVRLLNTEDQVYLFAKDSNEGLDGNPQGTKSSVPASSTFANQLPWLSLPMSATSGNTNPLIGYEATPEQVHYKHVFYPYPSNKPTDEAKAATLYIEGTLYPNDPERKLTVFFKKELKETDSTFLGFKRNHVYKFVINKATRDAIEASIVVDQWNTEEMDANVFKVKSPVIKGRNYDYNNRTKILTVSKAGGTTVLDVESNTEWEVIFESSVAPEWVTGVTARKDNKLTAATSEINNVLSFAVTPNTGSEERTTVLIVRSKAYPSKQEKFTIKQAGV